MKNILEIKLNIEAKRFRRKIKSKQKKIAKRRCNYNFFIQQKQKYNNTNDVEERIINWLPVNLKYLLFCDKSIFNINEISKELPDNNGLFLVPEIFSIIDKPNESFKFIRNILGSLLNEKYIIINIDYQKCKQLDLETQVLLDICLKDIIKYFKHCNRYKNTKIKVKEINGVNLKTNKYIEKLLFSVGSPVILKNQSIQYMDIVPYNLCVHDREQSGDKIKIQEQKDLDTTNMVDYVRTCLNKMGFDLTLERLEDLSTVIGEILINAEEHSTTKYRFSIGYFQDFDFKGTHYGVLNLTILNFGQTIYDKFKDINCPNQDVVNKMKELSEQYTRKNLFMPSKFNEETLWTLYALQDGVSSIATDRYRKRGHGSIQFIESFFNIKGRLNESDSFSRMVLLSGNTNITFDGTYNITDGLVDGEAYKIMSFNKSGNIEDMPDNNYVSYVDNYFPGTLISAKIMFNEDDLKLEYEHGKK